MADNYLVSTHRNGSLTGASLATSSKVGQLSSLYVNFCLYVFHLVHAVPQTHNITLVQPITSYVISIRDGHVVAQGSPIDVLAASPDIKEELQQEKEIMEKADQEVDIDADEPSHDNPKNAANTHVPTTGQLIMAEEIEEGHLSWPACTPFKRFVLRCLLTFSDLQ